MEARRQEAETAAAAVQQLTEQERKLEGEVEEAGKAVRARKEEADTLKDTENADVQHVQVCISCHVGPMHGTSLCCCAAALKDTKNADVQHFQVRFSCYMRPMHGALLGCCCCYCS